MEFIIFDYDKHYAEVCRWWAHHGWPLIHKESLSSYGVVAQNNGLALCAGWLYVTNSNMFWVEWLVTNPHAPLKIRAQGLEYLIEHLVKEGRAMGAKVAFTSTKSKGLIRMFLRRGFKESDLGMTNLVRLL